LSIQFMARPLDEAGLLRAGRAVEKLCDFDALRERLPQPGEAS
jgi:Asp-tRNA(Asn)/Glu-tRNA(Gln) amidotransferase A subunit family amidase